MANHTKRIARRKAELEERRKTCFSAHHRWARMSASKVRLVADQIRGMSINEALEQLQFSNRRSSYLLNKVVRSALANAEYQVAEQSLDVDVDRLEVADVQIGEGPVLKRWMTRARGMAYPILKGSCHISVTLSPPAEASSKKKGS